MRAGPVFTLCASSPKRLEVMIGLQAVFLSIYQYGCSRAVAGSVHQYKAAQNAACGVRRQWQWRLEMQLYLSYAVCNQCVSG